MRWGADSPGCLRRRLLLSVITGGVASFMACTAGLGGRNSTLTNRSAPHRPRLHMGSALLCRHPWLEPRSACQLLWGSLWPDASYQLLVPCISPGPHGHVATANGAVDAAVAVVAVAADVVGSAVVMNCQATRVSATWRAVSVWAAMRQPPCSTSSPASA
eukprot:5526382-Amphidinium_carterae.3